MSPHLVRNVRVSTNQQDLSSQQAVLNPLGVPEDLVGVDHGLTELNRERPGFQPALAACRAGDTLVATKLGRPARLLPDARNIVEDLTKRSIKLSLGGSIHDPTDPVGKFLFNVLAMVAEFESDLIQARTREGTQIAKGKLRRKQPKFSPTPENHLIALQHGGQHTSAEIAEHFGVARSTVYRILQRTPASSAK